MLASLLLAVTVAASPPPPLKTITHVRASALCSAFDSNIKYSVKGLLVNNDLFKRTQPVFEKVARDMVLGESLESGYNSLHAAQASLDNPSVTLDMNRMTAIADAIVKNLETINALLNDPAMFAKKPKSADDKQLVELRAQLLALAEQQNAELNVLTGTTEQYAFDQLYDADVGAGGALSATGKGPAKVSAFSGGPLNTLPGVSPYTGTGPNAISVTTDPRLQNNDAFMDSRVGNLYRALALEEAVEAKMEPSVARSLEVASASCK